MPASGSISPFPARHSPIVEGGPLVGQKFGDYEILEMLGKGGTGTVYQARHPGQKRLVAIKILSSHLSSNREYVKQFLAEGRTVAQLNHPNIISFYETGVFKNSHFLVMEYVKGQDLGRLLNSGTIFEETRAILLIQRVASALSYAHSEGIIHRDIKPENLFLTPEGQIKIGDLGLAFGMHVETSSDSNLVVGTPAYISPEQIMDANIRDPRTDIYSLGATFYHMLIGHPPYQGNSVEETLAMHLNEPVPWARSKRPDLSEGLCHILAKMMAKNVQDRFRTMDEAVAALNRLQGGGEEAQAPSGVSTLEAKSTQKTMTLLQKRLHGKTEFPSLAATMSVMSKLATINLKTSSDELNEVILNDFGLTNKLLKMANSAFYGAQAGQVDTISHALMILGLARVRDAAISMMIFQKLENKLMAQDLEEASIQNFLSGAIARNLGLKVGLANREEVFVCALFHNFGNILAIFYLPQEYLQIRELMDRMQMEEQVASRRVLGLSFQDLGIRIANEWNLPNPILFAMIRFAEDEIPPPSTEFDLLHRVVCFSNELADIQRKSVESPETLESGLEKIARRYLNSFSISNDDMTKVLERSLQELEAFTASLKQ